MRKSYRHIIKKMDYVPFYKDILSKLNMRRIDTLVDSWFIKAFKKREFNVRLVENYLTHIYRLSGLQKPNFLYAKGPLDAQTIFSDTRKLRTTEADIQKNLHDLMENRLENIFNSSIKQKVSSKVIGHILRKSRFITDLKLQLEANIAKYVRYLTIFSYDSVKGIQWSVFYEFLKESALFYSCEFDNFCTFIGEGGVFFTIYLPDKVILCPYPSSVSFNEKHQLHSDSLTEPSIRWDDGLSFVFNNGVYVPEVFWKQMNQINPLLILKEKNVEVRKEIINKVGIKKVIETIGAKVIDRRGKGYQLLRLNIPDMRVTPVYLKMLNPSTKEWHIEAVPPNITRVDDALAWRDSEDVYIIPSELT